MSSDSLVTLRGAKAGSIFESYARLVQCLYPRAKEIAFYGADGAAMWSNDSETETALTRQVRALLKDATDPEKSDREGLEWLTGSNRPAYLLWVRDERHKPLGVLGIAAKPVTREGSQAATLVEVERALRPVLQTLARELALMRRLPTAQQDEQQAQREQAEWLVERILPLMSAARESDALRAVLRRIVERTDCTLGAVIIPEHAIRVTFEAAGWSIAPAKEALDQAHRRVLARLQEKRRPLVFSRSKSDSSDRSQYRLLAAPLFERSDFVSGYVVLLKSTLGSDFSENDKRLLESVAPLVHSLIERDFDTRTDLQSAAGFERTVRHRLANGSMPVCSLIYIDIEDLAGINSRHDAAAGDRVLRRVSRLLRPPSVPANALSARLGGGHFACLLANRGTDEAEEIATRVREAAQALSISRQSDERVRLRTGVAPVAPIASGLRDALIAARAAAAPATPVIPEPKPAQPEATATPVASPAVAAVPTPASVSETMRLPQARVLPPTLLREALREGRLRLYAQPMRPTLDQRRLVRVELLPRIVDSRGDIIAARDFLATQPDPDALMDLDRWVLTSALDAFANHGTRAGPDLEFSMNVSSRSLEVPEFHTWLREQLKRSTVPGERWLFEITETTAALKRKDVARFAREIMKAGARLALDDVGSAGTDLVRLRTHGASSIKMDGSLVRDIASDPRAQRLVESLAHWAEASRMDTVAEQVESDTVRQRLAELGIDYVQGYVVGKPQPLEELLIELGQPSITVPLAANAGA